MKKIFYLSMLGISFFTAKSVKAQSGFDQLIKSGPADATKLTDAYAKPLFKGLGLGTNSGWTNTAQTLGLLHFDVRFTATAAFAPSSDQSFNVTQIGLSNSVRPNNPNDVIAPTFSGNTKANGPLMNIYDDNGNKVSSFTMPSGQLKSVIPTPQLQVTVGLIHNTDVTLRALPKVNVSDDIGSVSMIGFGIKHNIMGDIFGSRTEKLIPFDLALAFNYNRLNYNKNLNVQPESGALPADAQQSNDFSNQHITGHLNSFLFEAIISKQILFFTPYLAVGYNTSKTNVALEGNYPITSGSILNQKFYTTYSNPVNIDERSINGVRADIGFQIKLPVVRFYASYGLAESYSMVNAGIGLGF